MPKPSATIKHTMPIGEHEIRSSLLQFLAAQSDTSVRIQEEFRIERGASRIDVAVIGSRLIGYEIKSDADSFARFANQIHAYNRVFDQIYLVCGPQHITAALDVVPSWWGLLVAERMSNGVRIKPVRSANANPKQDPFSLASLLWKDEALAILESEAAAPPRRTPSHALWECIANSLPLETIKNAVAQSLLKRLDYSELAVKTM